MWKYVKQKSNSEILSSVQNEIKVTSVIILVQPCVLCVATHTRGYGGLSLWRKLYLPPASSSTATTTAAQLNSPFGNNDITAFILT